VPGFDLLSATSSGNVFAARSTFAYRMPARVRATAVTGTKSAIGS
jgi:hypothetical protein